MRRASAPLGDDARTGLAALLSGVANRVINLDPEARRVLSPLDGARIRIKVTSPLTANVLVAIDDAHVQLTEDVESHAHAELCGSASALVSMLRDNGSALPAAQGVEVRGDMRLLTAFARALAELDPDWDEPLARVLGDALAQPIATGIRTVAGHFSHVVRELRDTTVEYLREESGLLVCADDVVDFAHAVKTLSEDSERLHKRLSLIATRVDAME